jgi:3-oxoacyl-[acyl-carrier-protein] synthase II
MGLRTALGSSAEKTWRNLLAGVSGLEAFSTGSARAAVAWVRGVETEQKDDSRTFSLALAVSREAFFNAGLSASAAPCACVAGLGKPELGFQGQLDPGTVLSSYLRENLASAVSARLNLQGPALAISAACATGAIAVGLGSQWIRDGRCRAVLAVCADTPIHPLYISGFQRMGVLASVIGNAREAVKPFDRRRSGFGLGEGAAALILEEESSALGRGARPLARVSGFSQSTAGSHPVHFDGDGTSLAGALERTMALAHCRPKEVDYLNCHGTATSLNDALETRAVKKAFGRAAGGLSLSSTKASTGHMLSSTGAVEAAFAVLAIRDGQIPPTLNLEEPDPECDLDFTPLRSRPRPIRNAMSLSFGFGGSIGALLFSRC